MSGALRASKRRKLSNDDPETPTKSTTRRRGNKHADHGESLPTTQINDPDHDELQEIDKGQWDLKQGLSNSAQKQNIKPLRATASDDEDSEDGVETVIRVSSRQRKAPRRYSNEMVAVIKPRPTPRSQGSKASSPAVRKARSNGVASPLASQTLRGSVKRAAPTKPKPIDLTSDRSSPSPSDDVLQDKSHEREASPELDVPIYTPTKANPQHGGPKSSEIVIDVNGREPSPELDVPSYTPRTVRSSNTKAKTSSSIKQPDFGALNTSQIGGPSTPKLATTFNRESTLQRSAIQRSKGSVAWGSDPHVLLKNIVLRKVTGKRATPLVDLEEEYSKVHGLLKQTVAVGEGNSMFIIGARGTGKTALVNTILQELIKDHGNDFHVVRLNGFIHTDDKLALREIWRQLGQQMDVEDDIGKNYADTLATLLALLAQAGGPANGVEHEQQLARSVVFIMDEFDLFTAHARQTLLYNLFDIAQSRSAPIAVLGLTTRVDVTESLEKRVKSRFSQRYVHISLPKNLVTFVDICRKALQLQLEELDFDERAALVAHVALDAQLYGKADILSSWNASIETLLEQPLVKRYLATIYHATKSIPTALSLFLLPIANLTPQTHLSATSITAPATLLPPDSKLQLLPTLPTLSLALLIAAARLDIILDSDNCNFNMAYEEYCALGAKARVSAISSSGASAGVVGIGGKVAGRVVARAAWEKLVELELLIPAASGFSLGSGGGGVVVVGPSDMVKCDIKLEEVEAAVPGLEKGLVRWCREI